MIVLWGLTIYVKCLEYSFVPTRAECILLGIITGFGSLWKSSSTTMSLGHTKWLGSRLGTFKFLFVYF